MPLNYEMPTDELGAALWDYHKDMFGVRPWHVDFSNREAIISALKSCENHFNSECETREGRNRLRDNCWVINEPSAESDGWVDPYIEEAA